MANTQNGIFVPLYEAPGVVRFTKTESRTGVARGMGSYCLKGTDSVS